MIYYLPNISSDAAGFASLAALSIRALADTSSQVEIDFSRLAWFEANMAAPLGVVLNKLTDALKAVSLVKIPKPTEAILRRNGLLEAFGQAQPSIPSRTALPYRRFKLQDAALFAKYLQEHLPGKGIPSMSEGLGKRFQQSLFEVFENSAFHSRSQMGVFVCGQFFPLKQRVDITIADGGITIPRIVNDTFDWTLSPPDALRWVLTEGSTTKRGSKPGGVGLKLLRDFIDLNKGRLQIASGNAFWQFQARNELFQDMSDPFPGTVVNLEVNTADGRSYRLANEVSPDNVF